MWNVPGWKASAVFFSVNQNGEPGPPRAQQVSPPPPVRPMPCGPDHRARPPWRSDAARRCRCKRSPQGRQHGRGRPPPHPYPPQRALGVGTGAGCRSGGGGGGGGDVRLLPSSLPCAPRGLHTRERAGESRPRPALTSPPVAVTRARGRHSAESSIAQGRWVGGGAGGRRGRRGHTEHNGPAGWGGPAEHHHHPPTAALAPRVSYQLSHRPSSPPRAPPPLGHRPPVHYWFPLLATPPPTAHLPFPPTPLPRAPPGTGR